MALKGNITCGSGAVADHHVISQVVVEAATNKIFATINSYVDEAAESGGKAPLEVSGESFTFDPVENVGAKNVLKFVQEKVLADIPAYSGFTEV